MGGMIALRTTYQLRRSAWSLVTSHAGLAGRFPAFPGKWDSPLPAQTNHPTWRRVSAFFDGQYDFRGLEICIGL